MGSRLRIKNLRDEFTNSEEKIADYIIEYTDEVYHMTSEELAKATKTSPASVIRFSKKLGYEGFQELKIAIAKDSIDGEDGSSDKSNEEITTHDDVKEIIEKISSENMKAIRETASLLDEKAIDRATSILSRARSINIFGVGSSLLVGEEFRNKLIRINMPVTLHLDPYLQLVSASNMDFDDVAIGISHSGRTSETYKLLKAAKKAGARTISITKYGENPISDLADISLYTTEVERELRMGAMASRVAQLTVVDILFVNLIKRNHDKLVDIIALNSEIVDEMKIKK